MQTNWSDQLQKARLAEESSYWEIYCMPWRLKLFLMPAGLLTGRNDRDRAGVKPRVRDPGSPPLC